MVAIRPRHMFTRGVGFEHAEYVEQRLVNRAVVPVPVTGEDGVVRKVCALDLEIQLRRKQRHRRSALLRRARFSSEPLASELY